MSGIVPASADDGDGVRRASEGRLLGLDVGDRRIGLAVSIPPGLLILPAGYIQRRSRRADVSAILAAAAQRDAAAIVAGLPTDAQGRIGEQGRKIRSLLRAVEWAADIPVFMVDEAFSSAAAAGELADAGRSPGRERGAVDAGAAAVILRRFLGVDSGLRRNDG